MKIELKHICKYYGKVRANDGVDLTVEPHRIHAVLGENGAGKSTLMKILSGFIRKTSGDIIVDDRDVDFRTPAEAASMGIGMLYQDPLDFPNLSVLDNFMLGQTKGPKRRHSFYMDRLVRLAGHFNFSLNPDDPVSRLTVGERQQLELLRLLSLGVCVLILDEPTTGISEFQKETLFNALRRLADEGKSILLVSHKLEDIRTLCDTVTVLRSGRTVGTRSAPFDTRDLLNLMFDHMPRQPIKETVTAGDAVLAMSGVRGTGGRTGLKACDTVIHRREVVGLAGLEGSGQGVFLRIAAGLKKASAGTVELNNVRMTGKDPMRFQRAGTVFVPASRLEEGLFPQLTITEHVALRNGHGGAFIQWQKAAAAAARKIDRFRIAGTAQTPAAALSGGNQQRLLLSFLPASPSLLLLENPTRGLDLDSALWVWQFLLSTYGKQAAIVFASSELDEILMVADRILVFFEGRIVMDVPAKDTDSLSLGRAIAGRGV